MIFFDIDGTLVDHKGAENAAALDFLRDHASVFAEKSEDFVAQWHAVSAKHVRRYLAGEISFQGQRQARLKELFAHHSELTDAEADDLFSEYLKHYEESWKLYPDVKPCLNNIKGLPLGIISNGDSIQQRQKLEVLGIAGYFSIVVISGDIGIAKPDRGIFHAACNAGSTDPSDCIHVGDDLHGDVEGSISAGLKGVWLNRNVKECSTENLTISTLQELIEIIKSHNHRVDLTGDK